MTVVYLYTTEIAVQIENTDIKFLVSSLFAH